MTTTDPAIYLMVDGKSVPATSCDWLLAAPCGCVCGLTVVAGPHGVRALTAAAALAEFIPNAEKRKRDVKVGWTVRLTADRRAACDEMTLPNGCPHTPQWGVEPRPTPDGWTWAAHYNARRLHLAPTEAVADKAWRTATTLCLSEGYGWSAAIYNVNYLPECARCLKKAAQLITGEEAGK